MNSLNLRVSSVKTAENVKKNANIRAALVSLPKHYDFSKEWYCDELRNATTVQEQLVVVKTMFQKLSSDPQALQMLSDLFLYTPLKHPLRNLVLKLLIIASRVNNLTKSLIVRAMSTTINRLVEETKGITESSEWNIAITSLSGCIGNFDCSVKALEKTLSVVFPFLCNSLQKYLTEMRPVSSPSVRNEYYLRTHNTIRFILACVQEFTQHMKRYQTNQLKELILVCKEVILDTDIPMDPRTNSGILIAYISKIFDTYKDFVQEAKAIKRPNEIVLCVGVINTFGYDDFLHLSTDIRDVCNKTEEIANAHSGVPNILLCAARSLYQMSKILLQMQFLSASNLEDDTKLILLKLLTFAFCYLEHHMDSVRHICKDLLRNIVALAHKMSFNSLLQKIFDACDSERLALSMKCVVLLQTVGVLGSRAVLANCQNIFTCIFADHLGRDFLVNNLFEGLMCASRKELSYDDWKSLWIWYILQIAAANDLRLPDIEILVVKAVKCEPRIVQYIIEDTSKTVPISTKLSALWTVRKCGIEFNNFNEIMNNFSNDLHVAINSNSDETRIMALRLLVETHKTTELLSVLECKHLLTYLEYNANSQSPATRQKSAGLLSKALIRCELNLQRTLKEYKISPEDAANELPLHLKFLKEFIRILVDNLFQGANFSRRSLSLQLLLKSLHVALNCELKLESLLPLKTATVLLNTLSDSYESNKELAVNALKVINQSDTFHSHDSKVSCEELLELQMLLVSVRPLDSVTAAYRLEFYCSTASATNFGNYEETTYSPVYFSALKWLLQLLKQGLVTARESITFAAKVNPLYGILFAINHLLKRLDFEAFAQDIAWRKFVAELTMLCKDLTNVVGPIVNSDSPEGHLPNDFSALPIEFAGKGENEETDKILASKSENCKILSQKCLKIDLNNLKTTPQMVLLCAWRTVKEVSLLLGELVLRSPIQQSMKSEKFLLTKEQIIDIGEHFKQLLSETKHRGAFEQAYVGFSKLCTRLWRLDTIELNCLPMQWLRELICLITRDEQLHDKICATRRSAGIPFMVQALITSELQVGTGKALNFCIPQLVQICLNRTKRSAESRTHALNILRALFRCTDLNEAVAEFVSEGVMCALHSYEADTWSEKNSATLLFAALIVRIFGVQRSRDSENLNIRNRMTGRIFFLRYPKLYDFFLDELKLASELISERRKAHKLHPLLLILSRLYTSALEGTESNLKLSEFLPFISSCSACPEMQTRYLAAKAVVALITKDAVHMSILKICAEILGSIDDPQLTNLNRVHGQLLQVLLLVRCHKSPDVELIGDLSSTLVILYKKMHVKNAVILKAMLDICIEVFNCLGNFPLSQDITQNLLYYSTQKCLATVDFSYYYPVFRKSFFLYNMHILRLTSSSVALVDFLVTPLANSSVSLEHDETCLNVILLVLLRQRENSEELAPFELTEGEIHFMRSLNEANIEELCSELRRNKGLQNTLKEVIRKPIFYPESATKAYAIMSLLDNFDFTLISLIEESKLHPGDVKIALSMCVERFMLQNRIEFETCQLCLQYLTEIAQPWQPLFLRLKASKIMSRIAIHYRKLLDKSNITSAKAFISLMLSQLMDDDWDIRDTAAKTVLSILPEDIGFGNLVSTMAQRVFLQFIADSLVDMKADDNHVVDIFKIITEIQTSACVIDDGTSLQNVGSQNNTSCDVNNSIDFEVFDKNEANVFAEPLKAVTDGIEIFRATFSNRPQVLKVVEGYIVC